jgi:hypothetical protein
MGFDAGVEVDELTYDFSKFLPGVTGTIPEPTNEQLEALVAVLRKTFPTTTNPETGKTQVDLEAVAAATDEDSEAEAVLYDAISEFTSGSPSTEQLKALPFRPQRAFVGWLLGQFFSPES